MNKNISVNHSIQKHIIDLLEHAKIARFSELRPARTDTNLFTYHLNSLVKRGLVDKTEEGYSLSVKGLSYVDQGKAQEKLSYVQPKILTMLVVQNEEGDVLLQKRSKQPYIDTWTLPYGRVHMNDKSIIRAAQRVAFEKLGLENPDMEHAGECYVRVWTNRELLTSTLVHVFRMYQDEVIEGEHLLWVQPHKLFDYEVAPAVAEIMTRTFFKDPSFFEEFDVEWNKDPSL